METSLTDMAAVTVNISVQSLWILLHYCIYNFEAHNRPNLTELVIQIYSNAQVKWMKEEYSNVWILLIHWKPYSQIVNWSRNRGGGWSGLSFVFEAANNENVSHIIPTYSFEGCSNHAWGKIRWGVLGGGILLLCISVFGFCILMWNYVKVGTLQCRNHSWPKQIPQK